MAEQSNWHKHEKKPHVESTTTDTISGTHVWHVQAPVPGAGRESCTNECSAHPSPRSESKMSRRCESATNPDLKIETVRYGAQSDANEQIHTIVRTGPGHTHRSHTVHTQSNSMWRAMRLRYLTGSTSAECESTRSSCASQAVHECSLALAT